MEIKFQGAFYRVERGGRGLAVHLISAWTCFANRERSCVADTGPIRGVFQFHAEEFVADSLGHWSVQNKLLSTVGRNVI